MSRFAILRAQTKTPFRMSISKLNRVRQLRSLGAVAPARQLSQICCCDCMSQTKDESLLTGTTCDMFRSAASVHKSVLFLKRSFSSVALFARTLRSDTSMLHLNKLLALQCW